MQPNVPAALAAAIDAIAAATQRGECAVAEAALSPTASEPSVVVVVAGDAVPPHIAAIVGSVQILVAVELPALLVAAEKERAAVLWAAAGYGGSSAAVSEADLRLVALLAPNSTSLWAERRRRLRSASPQAHGELLHEELALVTLCTTVAPKIPELWAHRQWARAELRQVSVAAGDLAGPIPSACRRHPRNYPAWCDRAAALRTVLAAPTVDAAAFAEAEHSTALAALRTGLDASLVAYAAELLLRYPTEASVAAAWQCSAALFRALGTPAAHAAHSPSREALWTQRRACVMGALALRGPRCVVLGGSLFRGWTVADELLFVALHCGPRIACDLPPARCLISGCDAPVFAAQYALRYGTSGFGAVTGAASAAVAQPRVAIPPGQRRVLLRTMRCWVRRRRAAAVIALHFGGAEDRIGGRPSSIALACHAVAFMVRNGHGLRNADPARLAAACTSAQRVAAAVSAAVAAPLQRCFPVALCLQRSWLSSGRVAAVLGSVRVALAVAASVPAPRASHGPHSEEWRSIAQLRVVAAAAVRQLAHPAGWPVFANAQGSLLQVRAIVTATVAGTGGPCLDRLLCQAAAAASTQDPERSDQLRRLAPSVATAWRDHLASKPAAPPSVPQVLRVPWYAVGPTATMPAALAELASVPWAARCASVAEELRGCPTAILNLIACGHHAPDEAASNSWLAAVDSVVLRSLLAAEPEPWWQRGVLRPLLKGEHSAHCAMAGLWSRPALAAVAAAVHVEEAPRGRPSESTALSGGSVLDKFASLLRDDGPALGVVVPLATATVITAEASHAFTAPLWARWGWAVHLLAKETRSFGAVQSLLLHHPGLGHRLWSCVTGPQLTALTNLVLAGNAPPAVARAVDAAWCVALDVIGHSLLVVGDEEFTALGVPFPPPVAATAAQCLTSLLVLRNAAATAVGPHLIEARASARRTLRLLVDRHARCPLVLQGGGSPFAVHPDVAVRCRAALKATGESVALLDEAAATKLARKARGSADGREMFVMHASSSVVVAALHDAPAALPFFARLELLHSWIAQDRARLPTAGRTKVRVTVRRARCLEDGFEQLMRFGGEAMRMPFFVEFVGVHGVKEEGIDAGGVFKEFIEVLSKQAFDPAVGLFCRTDEGRIYPNPHAARLYPGDWRSSFRFIGRVLGKALYEGVVVHLPFARFVLNNLLGRGNTVDDLVTLDPAHHRALRSLLAMDDVADAGLYMSHDEDVLGETVTTDLVPGGRDIAVTTDNVIRFQHSLVRHRLVDAQAGATAGFVEGLGDVLPVAWLRMFSATELQQLISGGDVPLDVTDLAAHCKYAGGYTASDRSVKLLWEVVGEMGREDQGRFLQFCTGSSCPPLLGFGALNPPFTVSRASGGSSAVKDFFLDIDRLPSASTCFNLLKLPPYMAKSNLAEKLTAAIRADSGFGLS